MVVGHLHPHWHTYTANNTGDLCGCHLDSQRRELRLREGKWLAQGPTANKRKNEDFNPDLPSLNPFSSQSHTVIRAHAHKLVHVPNLKSSIISNCPKCTVNTGPVPLEQKNQWGWGFLVWCSKNEPLRFSVWEGFLALHHLFAHSIKPLFTECLLTSRHDAKIFTYFFLPVTWFK